MSATPSPVISPAVLSEHIAPPHQQLSKRDKRRNLMADRLRDLQGSFERDRDIHYRAQLQALQQNLQAVSKLDISNCNTELLDDDPDYVDRLLNEGGIPAERSGIMSEYLLRYINGVNDFVEQRDVALAQLKKNHEDKMYDYRSRHHKNLTQARLEHYQLASTLKQRLITRLTNSKKKLAADKEHSEFAESSVFSAYDRFALTAPSTQVPYMSPSRDNGSATYNAGSTARRNLRQRRNDDLLGVDFGYSKSHKKRRHPNSPLPQHRSDSDNDDSSSPAANDIVKPHLTVESLFNKPELQQAASISLIAASRFVGSTRESSPDSLPSPNYALRSGAFTETNPPLDPHTIERELSHAATQIQTRSTNLALPAQTGKTQSCPGPVSLKPEDAIDDLEAIRRAIGGGLAAPGGASMKRSASVAGMEGAGAGKRKRGGGP